MRRVVKILHRAIYNNVNLLFITIGPPPSPPNTLERKIRKTSTLECKEKVQKLRILHIKNVNKRKNRLTPVKLESKEQDKKNTRPMGRPVSISVVLLHEDLISIATFVTSKFF